MSIPAATHDPDPRLQITSSPYQGETDFSLLDGLAVRRAPIDPVSIADLLRNAFVYPPHSIYRGVKVANFGFDPGQVLHQAPEYRFAYRRAPAASPPSAPAAADQGRLLKTYHRLLCDAVARSTAGMHSPWVMQSGGKDSTSLAIAVAEVCPQATCLTYLGGREEDEVASARLVARQLGLRHEALVCDPGRAYDRYLALVPRMPLLSADFAMLSYADLVTEIAAQGGDGVLDGVGSDPYFGAPLSRQQRMLQLLARGLRLPPRVFDSALLTRSFKLCFALATVQMDPFERFFPGSRFSDAEVDALLGRGLAAQSRQRLELFRGEIVAADTPEARRRLAVCLAEAGAAFAKGLYTTSALSLRMAYPFCDARLCEWVFSEVPEECRIDPATGANKVLVRDHIACHFGTLPYVASRKGSFRFELCGLARERFDQVHAFAGQARALLPGAVRWLEAHRPQLDNKFFASKFYLLAVVLPWVLSRMEPAPATAADRPVTRERALP